MVSSNEAYSFTKPNRESVTLLTGLGVEGDVHAGVTVKHRSRVAQDPTQPNLRQVHLIQEELFDELREAGFEVAPGDLGENLTTRGIDLLALPVGARLYLGDEAVVEVTGAAQPVPPDRQLPGRTAQAGRRPRRGGKHRPQGRHHERGRHGRYRQARRPDPGRAPCRAAPAAGAGLTADTHTGAPGPLGPGAPCVCGAPAAPVRRAAPPSRPVPGAVWGAPSRAPRSGSPPASRRAAGKRCRRSWPPWTSRARRP